MKKLFNILLILAVATCISTSSLVIGMVIQHEYDLKNYEEDTAFKEVSIEVSKTGRPTDYHICSSLVGLVLDSAGPLNSHKYPYVRLMVVEYSGAVNYIPILEK